MNILWIDDEIEILKPHIKFLEKKGYHVTPINNASDGVDKIASESFRAVLLDENMPGIGGLEAIMRIKEIQPTLPIIMITKNEEEHIMEEAIGRQISDYILKPVNPNQIILSLKKVLKSDEIIEEKTIIDYQQEFRKIAMDLMDVRTFDDWSQLYNKLVSWEIRLDKVQEDGLREILQNQMEEANSLFSRFIEKNYGAWLHNEEEAPKLSHQVVEAYLKPEIENDEKVLFLVIDNLRLDQWKVIAPLFTKSFSEIKEKRFYSILPTATQYARNALFAGMMPSEIAEKYPTKWMNDTEEGNKNDYESDFFEAQLKQIGLGNKSHHYIKILNSDFEKKMYEQYNRFKSNDIITVVYNFLDILSHAKTDNQVISQLIRDDKSYRSLSYTWFENSSILQMVRLAAQEGRKVIITTDHGTQFITTPSKVLGDRDTSTNLRYKMGRNLQYDPADVFAMDKPEAYFLPKVNLSSKYIFAKNNLFLVYPNNYNKFVNHYKDTYQHGGVSLQEIIVPFVVLS